MHGRQRSTGSDARWLLRAGYARSSKVYRKRRTVASKSWRRAVVKGLPGSDARSLQRAGDAEVERGLPEVTRGRERVSSAMSQLTGIDDLGTDFTMSVTFFLLLMALN
jgi:hypothetical protein